MLWGGRGIMEILKELVQTMSDYIWSNNLNIDKVTFFTIVIGQIAIYGILLTFYQFIASYNESENIASRYLGINTKEYFLRKNLKNFERFVLKKTFRTILILEILYKPFIVIYGDKIHSKIISLMNFIWFAFVIFYFLFSVILFFKCVESVLKIKGNLDAKTNEELIHDIDKMFLKRTIKQRIEQKPLELLRQDLSRLREAIKIDNNSDLQERYNDLIDKIFDLYINKKIKIEDTLLKRGVRWSGYIINYEKRLLQEIMEGRYFNIDERNLKSIFYFHMEMVKINTKTDQQIFDLDAWKNIVLSIYQKLSDEGKRKIICDFRTNINKNNKLYQEYFEKCISSIIKDEIDRIFKGERKQEEFIEVFGRIITIGFINNLYAEELKNKIIYNTRFDVEKLLNQLRECNRTYLFTYIIIYYSIYKSQIDWKYINVNTLKALWKQHGNMQDNTEYIVQKLNFDDNAIRKIYIKFTEYIEADFDEKLLTKIREDKILNVFYIWVVKVCVVNQENLRYSVYESNFDVDIRIINELSKHDELLVNKNIINWVYRVRYGEFMQQSCFPKKLNITLRNLLLTNINIRVVLNYVSENPYLYSVDCIGEYLLIRIHELLPIAAQKEHVIKETIKTAFIKSRENVDEYINRLEKECDICKCEINYVQRMKIEEYLETFRRVI